MLANEPETCNDVETKITKHFTRLHGVLQNIQAKLLDQLHHPRNSMKNDLKEISLQLQKQEEQLSAALRVRLPEIRIAIRNNWIAISSLLATYKAHILLFIYKRHTISPILLIYYILKRKIFVATHVELDSIRKIVEWHLSQYTFLFQLASYTKENFNKVDMRNTIKVLNEMADVPCHLVRNNCTQDEGIL